jgi:hypothetical protein
MLSAINLYLIKYLTEPETPEYRLISYNAHTNKSPLAMFYDLKF